MLAGLIRTQVADVNMVSAPIMIKEKGIILSEVKRDKTGVFDGYIKLTVKTDNHDPLGRRHGVLRRQAALHPDQGHQPRRRCRHRTWSTSPTPTCPA